MSSPLPPSQSPAKRNPPLRDRPNLHADYDERHRHPDRRPCDEMVNVKVWQLPVRIFHWTFVITILLLSVTGFYIGTPAIAPESRNLMHDARMLHMLGAYVFMAALIGRLVFMFTGNGWASWRQFLPMTRERRRLIGKTLRYYFYLAEDPPPVVGHNPLAGMTYLVVFAMFACQAVTGLALASLDERGSGWEWAVSGWTFSLASAQMVRLIHHLFMWLLIGFVVHHVYSAVLVDVEERSGEVSSIISGWKTIPCRRLQHERRIRWQRRQRRLIRQAAKRRP